MTNQDINKWIMYHEIHKLNRFGFSTARIARYLVMDPRSVAKYLRMNEDQYEEYNGSHIDKIYTDDGRFLNDMLPFFDTYLKYE